MIPKEKITVENSVENVDNSLNSRPMGRLYVKQKAGFVDNAATAKRPRNGAFSMVYKLENGRMTMHRAVDIRLVIDFEKKTIDSRVKMWYYNPA